MFKNKGLGFYLWVGAVFFALGIFVGSFYAAGLTGEAFSDVLGYLKAYFEGGVRNRGEVFLNSFLLNLRLFVVIFLSGFFKFTMPLTIVSIGFEGFTSGFTTASLIKVFGTKGLLLGLSGIVSTLIFIVNLVFFGAWSMKFSLNNGKNDRFFKKNYFILSGIALTIFCIASLSDGYITTTFMGLIVNKL